MSDDRNEDPQPAPTRSPFPELWPTLIARMQERHVFGVKRYKVALQPFNGRDALKDLTDEALDQLVYTTQWFYENRPIRDQVRELKVLLKQPTPDRPALPSEERMLFSLALFAEEAFEVLEAVYPLESDAGGQICEAKELVMHVIRTYETRQTDLVLLVDALGDSDVVTEGFRQELGVDGRPVAALIHDANMKKQDGPIDPVTKKTLKPPGWTAPDIAGELRRQGWIG